MECTSNINFQQCFALSNAKYSTKKKKRKKKGHHGFSFHVHRAYATRPISFLTTAIIFIVHENLQQSTFPHPVTVKAPLSFQKIFKIES